MERYERKMRVSIKNLTMIFVIFAALNPCFAASEAKRSPLIWNVPEVVVNFTGRDQQLLDLKQLLTQSSAVGVIIGITGIGKTQLARYYARKSYENYDMIWWIDGASNINHQMRELAFQWNRIHSDPDEKIEIEHLSRKRLRHAIKEALRRTNKSWLLIFDNASSRDSIKDYLPKTDRKNKQHIIITSQNSLSWSHTIPLGKLRRQESLELLSTVLQNTDRESLNLLAENLGDYPLALTELIKFLRVRPKVKADEYIRIHLRKREEKMKQNLFTSKVTTFDDSNLSAISAIDVTLDKIEESTPAAYELLLFASLLNPTHIPRDLLNLWVRKHSNKESLDDLVSSLMQYSCFEKEDHSSEECYRLHDALRFTLHSRFTADKSAKLLDSALKVLVAYYPKHFFEFNNFIQNNTNYIYHLEQAHEFMNEIGHKSPELFTVQLRLLEYYLYEERDFKRAEQLIKDMSLLSNKGIAADPLSEAQFHIVKGSFLMWCKSNFKSAVDEFQASLKMLKKDDQYTQEILRNNFNIAQAYYSQGDVDECLKYCEMGDKLVKQHPDILGQDVLYGMYSRALLDDGQYEAALKFVDAAIKKNSEISKSKTDYFGFLTLKNKILLRMGETATAQINLLKLREQVLKYFGDSNNFFVARINILLSSILLDQNKEEDALALISETKNTVDSCYPPHSHRDQALARITLGSILSAQGNFKQAYKEYVDATEIYNSIFKKFKIDQVARLYEQLAIVGVKLKEDAITKKFLRLLVENFGLDHARTKKVFGLIDQDKQYLNY